MKPTIAIATAVLLVAALSMLGAGEITEGAASSIRLKRSMTGTVEPLGETVELTFRLKSDNPQTMTVTSATTKYGIEVRFTGNNAAAHIEIGGDLRLVTPTGKSASAADAKLLVTSQAFVGYDAEVMIDSYIVSSAVVGFGEERELAKFGAVTLTVQAKRAS